MSIINNLLAQGNFFGSAFFIVSVAAVVVLAAMLVMLKAYYRKRAEVAEAVGDSSAEEEARPEEEPEEQIMESVAPEETSEEAEEPEEEAEEEPVEETAEEQADEEPVEESEEEPEEEPEGTQPDVTGEVAAAAVPVAAATDNGIKITQRKSFLAKLILNRDLIPIYEELKDVALSYKKVKSLISFKCEKFSCGRKILMRFFVKGKRLYIYYATTVEGHPEKYRLIDVSDKGIGKQLPTLQKIRSTRSVKYAKEMIASIMESNEIVQLPPEKVKKTDYSELLKKRSVSKLIEEGLIKEV